MSSGPNWLDQLADNPIVQVLVFVIMFVIRLEADRWQRRRAERHKHKKKAAAAD